MRQRSLTMKNNSQIPGIPGLVDVYYIGTRQSTGPQGGSNGY